MDTKSFSVYDLATGRILQSGNGLCMAPPGRGTVDDEYDGATFYVDEDGTVRAYPSPQPHLWATFNRATGQWEDQRGPEELAQALAEARAGAVATINAAAGRARLAYITDIPGQEALYMLKQMEATEFLSAADPDPEDYPLVAAEVGITADTPYEVAQVYANLAAYYRHVAAQLEHARLGHVLRAETAPDEQTAGAVVEEFITLLQGAANG